MITTHNTAPIFATYTNSACSKVKEIVSYKDAAIRSVNDDTTGTLFYLTNTASHFLSAQSTYKTQHNFDV
jgi:hypothetical protein